VGLKHTTPPNPVVANMGLNRTSVGLKRGSPRVASAGGDQPQSNQRGIETRLSQSRKAARS